MSAVHPSTLPITLAELLSVDPLRNAAVAHVADPARSVERVMIAETFERLQQARPHALIVMHAEAASGGWSLAAALHAAWERNASAVVAPSRITSPAGIALARRLNLSLVAIDDDPLDVALRVAAQVSAPAATRALRQARLAEQLADQTTLRGVLGVLNSELGAIPVALANGDRLLAGRAAALVDRPGGEQLELELSVPGERPWARLVAMVPAGSVDVRGQTETLLRVARPALLAVWAQGRLNSSLNVDREHAAFGLLRRLATAPARAIGDPGGETLDGEAPSWSTDFGWQLDGANRAVWFALDRLDSDPSSELTHFLRTGWQRGHTDRPFIAETDGWVSWVSEAEAHGTADLRRALREFRSTAEHQGLVIGVGRAHDGVGGLMTSVAEARLAAHVARTATDPVQWFDQVGPAAALATLPIAEIGRVAELALPDLMQARDRGALVDTVLAVLDCGGSLSQASQRLGVHRNTVLARVTRARTLGLELDDPEQRLSLHTLCYALAALDDSRPAAPAATAAPGQSA